jgi:hypothetical protein
MAEKRPYSPPQIFQVDLNLEQAILTVCSIGVTSVIGSGNARCLPVQSGLSTGCKNASASGGISDAGARTS